MAGRKRKGFIILALVCMMCVGMGITAFASVDIKNSDGEVIATVPDLPEGLKKNYFIYEYGNRYYLCTSDNELSIYYNASYGYFPNCVTSDMDVYTVVTGATTGDWSVRGTNQSICNDYMDSSGSMKMSNCNLYVYKSKENAVGVVNDGTKTDEVFFKAPKVGALQTVVKTINLGGVLSEIVSLMPLVLSVIILYLGLRKGLNFVSTHLRQA